jgi:hypothetical protein
MRCHVRCWPRDVDSNRREKNSYNPAPAVIVAAAHARAANLAVRRFMSRLFAKRCSLREFDPTRRRVAGP